MTSSPDNTSLPPPMEARLIEALPTDTGWQFEPKWDGFRAIAARTGDEIELMSKSGKSLARFFPEIVDLLRAVRAEDFILDAELVLPIGDALSFDALQQRLHPAASRIAKLSAQTPARLMIFDILRLGGEDLASKPLTARRSALETFHAAHGSDRMLLSPATPHLEAVQAWLMTSGGALDGIVAKRLGEPYRSGERAMVKVKPLRSADCVVGGYRATADGTGIASLLLGLLDEDGKLDHVGFTSGFFSADRPVILAKLRPLEGGAGFTGKAPGGPSRWRKDGDGAWTPLKPDLVAEVVYDQVTARRFRHGTRFLRWRPDKHADQCTFDQLAPPLRPAELSELLARTL
jgi:ATP-dependent DNA ligase